jgi:hypothetical protein
MIRWIIRDQQSFRVTENADFRDFMKAAAPTFKVVGKSTISKDVLSMFKEERQELVLLLKRNTSKYSFTTDAWTSRSNLAFMAVTIHWINSDWELREQTLDFAILHGSHTGVNLAKTFCALLDSFNIMPARFLSMTSDNASNNGTMMAEICSAFLLKGVNIDVKQNWIPCVAHTMNLAVQVALSHLKIAPAEDELEDSNEIGSEKPPIVRLRKLIVKVLS